MHTGFQDSTPMIVFIGQVGNEFVEREAFQEIDYRPHVRADGEMGRADRSRRAHSRICSHAFHIALRGRPGPVVLALPEDMLFAEAAVADAPKHHAVRPRAGAADMEQLRENARAAQSVRSCIARRRRLERAALRDLQRFVEANGLPVGASFRCQDLFDNRSRNYVGDVGIGINPKLAERVKNARRAARDRRAPGRDDDRRYTLLEVPRPEADADSRPRRRRGARARLSARRSPINSGMPAIRGGARATQAGRSPAGAPTWRPLRASYLEVARRRVPMPGDAAVSAKSSSGCATGLPEDTIVAERRRQLRRLAAPLFRYRGFRTQLGADERLDGLRLSGGASARSSRIRSARSIAFRGDGDFLMNGQELATAVQYGANVRRRSWSTTASTARSACTRSASIPGRVYGTDLRNPDFAAYARAFGAHGETVERTADFAPAFERAWNAASRRSSS